MLSESTPHSDVLGILGRGQFLCPHSKTDLSFCALTSKLTRVSVPLPSAGELYVIVEYCHFGNLRSYLLKHKDSFCDTMDENQALAAPPGGADSKLADTVDGGGPAAAYKDPSKPYYVNKAGGPGGSADTVGPPLTTRNLICWAFQVSRGMEYLSCKKVRR